MVDVKWVSVGNGVVVHCEVPCWSLPQEVELNYETSKITQAETLHLTLWPWSWTFTVEHTIYVKCEYFMNQDG